MKDHDRDPGPSCPICHGPLRESPPLQQDQAVFDCSECSTRLIVPDCAWHIAVLMEDARRDDRGRAAPDHGRASPSRPGAAIKRAVWHVLL